MKHRTTLALDARNWQRVKIATRWLAARELEPSTATGLIDEAVAREVVRLAEEHRNGEPWEDAPGVPFVTSSPIPASKRYEILERDRYRCRSCGVTAAHARLEVDHIVPLSLGGGPDLVNLQTLCETCNAGKGTRVDVGEGLA